MVPTTLIQSRFMDPHGPMPTWPGGFNRIENVSIKMEVFQSSAKNETMPHTRAPKNPKLDKGIGTICQARDCNGSHDRVAQMCPGLWRNVFFHRHQNLEDFSPGHPVTSRGFDSLQKLEDGTWVYLRSRARHGGRYLELRCNQIFPTLPSFFLEMI